MFLPELGMTVAVGPNAARSNVSTSGYAVHYSAGEYDVHLRVVSTDQTFEEALEHALVSPTDGVSTSSTNMVICDSPAASVTTKLFTVIERTIVMVRTGHLFWARISRDGKETPEEIVDAFLETIDCSP